MNTPITSGINHLGLAVQDLNRSVDFFVTQLSWTESGRDASYPRAAVSDGVVRLTLWQIDHSQPQVNFNRRTNVGLHHLALQVDSEEALNALALKLQQTGIEIEFLPELVGQGPRKHMMCNEPGGIRIEFIWPGTD